MIEGFLGHRTGSDPDLDISDRPVAERMHVVAKHLLDKALQCLAVCRPLGLDPDGIAELRAPVRDLHITNASSGTRIRQ